jgi:hypothetical protein
MQVFKVHTFAEKVAKKSREGFIYGTRHTVAALPLCRETLDMRLPAHSSPLGKAHLMRLPQIARDYLQKLGRNATFA